MAKNLNPAYDFLDAIARTCTHSGRLEVYAVTDTKHPAQGVVAKIILRRMVGTHTALIHWIGTGARIHRRRKGYGEPIGLALALCAAKAWEKAHPDEGGTLPAEYGERAGAFWQALRLADTGAERDAWIIQLERAGFKLANII